MISFLTTKKKDTRTILEETDVLMTLIVVIASQVGEHVQTSQNFIHYICAVLCI